MFTVASAASVNRVESPKFIYGQPVNDNYDTRSETLSCSSMSYTDPTCLEDGKSDMVMGASTQDDSVVENESDNIAIDQNIKDVQLEDNESIEIVFYEMNDRTDVFNELFAELFVAATTPCFHPDTDYVLEASLSWPMPTCQWTRFVDI
jgi:hypothetical protein